MTPSMLLTSRTTTDSYSPAPLKFARSSALVELWCNNRRKAKMMMEKRRKKDRVRRATSKDSEEEQQAYLRKMAPYFTIAALADRSCITSAKTVPGISAFNTLSPNMYGLNNEYTFRKYIPSSLYVSAKSCSPKRLWSRRGRGPLESQRFR